MDGQQFGAVLLVVWSLSQVVGWWIVWIDIVFDVSVLHRNKRMGVDPFMMTEKQREALYNKAWKHFGSDMQLDICIEEMAEFIQAILKTRRNGVTYSHAFFEEMADVLICIEQIQTRLKVYPRPSVNRIVGDNGSLYDQVLELREQKLLRLQHRLEESIAQYGEVKNV